MKAAQINTYGDPSVITINDVPIPAAAAGRVLVKVKAMSLNPFDTTIRTGAMKDSIPLTFPVTLGGDIAGIVTEIGDGVNGLSIGDTVYGQANVVAGNSGAFAEYAMTDAGQVSRSPKGLTFAEAAALPLAGVSALQALTEHLALQAGQKLFVHGGAGGIGTIALQIARSIGAHVVTTAKGADVEYVKALGADEVIDYTSINFTEVLNGFDAVFDTVGGGDFAKALRILRPGGAAVSMIAPPNAELASQLGVSARMQQTGVTTERLTALTALIENGAVKPQIGKVFPFDDIVDAFIAREAGGIRGKVVLELDSE